MVLTEKQKGEAYAFGSAFIWAFFPIIAALSYVGLPSLLSLIGSMIFATAFFAIVMTVRRSWGQLRDPLVWRYSLYISFFIGFLFYSFYYIGLTMTTPGNASIVAVFEVFTTFLFFNIIKKEAISREHLVGAILLVLGAGIILLPSFEQINFGDFMILAATFCAPLGNHYQRVVRKIASSETIMFLRSVISIPFIALLAYFLGTSPQGIDIKSVMWFLALNGVIVFGFSKIFWVEAIHRISVTKAMLIGNLGPVLTLILAWLILGQAPTGWQLSSLIPTILGVLFLTDQLRLRQKASGDMMGV